METDEKVYGDALQMVRCRMIKPRAYRTLSVCKSCSEYGGFEELSPEQNGVEAQYVVICKLPTQVLVENLIEEGSEDGGTK